MEKIPVINVKGHVDYSEGSVVSKTLLDSPVGTITFFAFAAGQGLSEHAAPYDAVVQVIDGNATITIDGVPYAVGEGNMIVMPANHPHALRAEQPFKMLLTMIRG